MMAKLVAKIQGLANEIANVKRKTVFPGENGRAIVARTVSRQGIRVSAGKEIDRHRQMCVGRVIARVVCVRASVRVIVPARLLSAGMAKEIGIVLPFARLSIARVLDVTVLLHLMIARVVLLRPNYNVKPSGVRS